MTILPRETRAARLTERLRSALQPLELHVVDDSHRHIGHAGAADGRGHFSVHVVSDRFASLSVVRRHRLVYDAVGDMLTTDIHALAISALAPGEGQAA